MSALPPPRNRRELMALLTDACELEHGIACSYLYAAFSLKKQSFDRGLTPEQLRLTRYWASQIFFVAGEEMLHLAQAWNLLAAIGGAPYCLRPNLPQDSRYYPIRARLSLEPFGVASLRRFITYETPAEATLPWVVRAVRLSRSERAKGHVTIGALYEAIAEGFSSIPGIIVASRVEQIGPASAIFPDLVQVHDIDSAARAVAMITHQGEGTTPDRIDCHYGVFRAMLESLQQERRRAGESFEPARPVMENPVSDSVNGYGANAHPIRNPVTRRAAELFDGVYALMLQSLALAFQPGAHEGASRLAAAAAIEAMAAVVRPLGEALTTMPSGRGRSTAGPAFGLVRFAGLAQEPVLALQILGESLQQFAQEADALGELCPHRGEFEVSASRMREIAARMNA